MGRPWEQNYPVNSLKLFVIVDTRLFMPLLPHVENFRYMKFSIKDVGMACQKVHKQEREDIYKSESKCIKSCPFLRLFTTDGENTRISFEIYTAWPSSYSIEIAILQYITITLDLHS